MFPHNICRLSFFLERLDNNISYYYSNDANSTLLLIYESKLFWILYIEDIRLINFMHYQLTRIINIFF